MYISLSTHTSVYYSNKKSLRYEQQVSQNMDIINNLRNISIERVKSKFTIYEITFKLKI